MNVTMLPLSTVCCTSPLPALSSITRVNSSQRLKNARLRFFAQVRREFSMNGRTQRMTFASGTGEQTLVVEEEDEATQTVESQLLKVFPGQAHPLGVSEVDSGTNFAIFSQNATAVTLCLVLQERGTHKNFDEGMIELSLDPQVNKTGNIWHICVEDLPRSNVCYGYRVNGPQDWHQGHRFDDGNILIDPYAKIIEGRRVFGDASNKMSKFMGIYDFDCCPFDWGENYKLPNIPEVEL